MVERGGLENRYTLTGIGGSNPSRSVLIKSLQGFAKELWRRGRAVIQRFAKPSVQKCPGRFNPCRLRYFETVAQLD